MSNTKKKAPSGGAKGSKAAPEKCRVSILLHGTDERPLLTLRLKGDPDVRRSVRPGEWAEVAPGDYYVFGESFPVEEGRIFGGSVYLSPVYTVFAEISVSSPRKEYSVGLNYDCIALALDTASADRLLVRGYSGAVSEMRRMADAGRYRVVYVRGAWVFPGLSVEAVPSGVRHELVTDRRFLEDALPVEPGFCYVFTGDGRVRGVPMCDFMEEGAAV